MAVHVLVLQCIVGKLHTVPWDLDECIMQYKHLSLMLNI